VAGTSATSNTVYVNANQHGVYALSWNLGFLWQEPHGVRLDSKSIPAATSDLVYVGEGDNNIYALNSSDGSTAWRYTADDYVDASPQVANGVVYVGAINCGSKLCDYALDARTGGLIWKKTLNLSSCGVYCPHQNADLLVYNGVVFGISPGNSGTLYALNAQNGQDLWSIPMPNTGYFLLDQGTIYVDTPSGVTAIAMDTHATRWALEMSNTTYGLLAAANGVVYVVQVTTDSQAESIVAKTEANTQTLWSTQIVAPQPTPTPTT
jgi:outer membrane protein assembly factor BamB